MTTRKRGPLDLPRSYFVSFVGLGVGLSLGYFYFSNWWLGLFVGLIVTLVLAYFVAPKEK